MQSPEEGATPSSGIDVHLTCANKSGSVEHYYHFFLGHLYPLLLAYEKLEQEPAVSQVLVRSCAVMDSLLEPLGLDKLRILPRDEHAQLASSVTVKSMTEPGYDRPVDYHYRPMVRATRVLLRRLAPSIDEAAARLPRPDQPGPAILLIDRKPPDDFYTSGNAEISSSGSQRRSIGNFTELANALQGACPNTRVCYLEDHTLAEQIVLFQRADIIVGQHGAALVNAVFCNSHAALVEIYPRDLLNPGGGYKNHFLRLAQLLGLPFRRVLQQSSHSAIDCARVMAAIAEIRRQDSLPQARQLQRILWFHLWQLRLRLKLWLKAAASGKSPAPLNKQR
ncbi:glycosyltransferase family 61 protein [Haliea sp. E17]|uniref:glycosyltransferase family 61 protein n=1 Tax=Haliea sp. E17 TaxID=3401576 RepID=UPI003AAF4A1E